MQIAAVYTNREESDDYCVVLACGCTLHVPEGILCDPEFPCPLHEETRFTFEHF